MTPVIDIKTIMNKTEEEVSKILGHPNRTVPGKWRFAGTMEWLPNSPINTYKHGLIEVKFIEKKAIRITVFNIKAKYPGEVLPSIGLKPGKFPEFVNRRNAVWLNTEGIYKIIAFSKGDNKVQYTYIITDEKYK